jgi:hypothetical protein
VSTDPSLPALARLHGIVGLTTCACLILLYAGAFGLVGVPGILLGIDDMNTAPAWTFVAGLSWAGTYLLFPAWSLRLARQDRTESVR